MQLILDYNASSGRFSLVTGTGWSFQAASGKYQDAITERKSAPSITQGVKKKKSKQVNGKKPLYLINIHLQEFNSKTVCFNMLLLINYL